MKVIKQSTYETCLACCLLMVTNSPTKEEIEIWKHGWKFNYLIGQLNYAAKKYNKKIAAYIESSRYLKNLQKINAGNVELVKKKINLDFLLQLLEKEKVVVYLDSYYPYQPGYAHAPHFVVALRRIGNFIEVADPWDGKIHKFPLKLLKKAIDSLRDHLKYSPVLLTVSK